MSKLNSAVLPQLGLPTSASSGPLKAVVNDMVEKVRALGPLHLEVPDEAFAEEAEEVAAR